MRVCYFGTYDRFNLRNEIIIEGLRERGVEVTECHEELWKNTAHKVGIIHTGLMDDIRFLRRLLRAYLNLIAKYLKTEQHDAILVGYAGHIDVFLAKVLAILTRRPLVFDVYQSLHDTIVLDRELASQGSMIARLAYFLDKCSCLLADVVLLDTNTHIDHFYRKFGVEKSKFRRIFVGVNDWRLEPAGRVTRDEEEEGAFIVTYFGGYVPLHGLEHVIEAAKKLAAYPDIKFNFIGNGQTYEAIRLLANKLGLKNVTFFETGPPGQWMPLEELATHVVKADACLGVFGLGAKATWVIPNKVPAALAMRKPVITGDTPAVREALVNRESVLLCERGNAQALAEAILLLRANQRLRQEITQNGHEVFLREFSIKAIGRQIEDVLIGLQKGAKC